MTISAEAEVKATPARSKTRPAQPPETPEHAVSGLLDVAGTQRICPYGRLPARPG